MEDQYGIPDLRQFIIGRPLYPPPTELPSTHSYDMLTVFRSDSTNTTSVTTTNHNSGGVSGITVTAGRFSGLEMEASGDNGGGGRWPRQETLTLLEIRSRLDPKFKEANQKGPLWDQVSRIMCEEHGYQRSGKKCREKFENLYKYYKKTKDGKAGRQDGKHYRFFRQLEGIYGETNNSASPSEPHLVNGNNPTYKFPNNSSSSLPNYNHQDTSLSNLSENETTSSDDNDLNEATCDNDSDKKTTKKRSKRRWKIKIKDFIDTQMRKLMEKQESWMEKIMNTIEQREQERISREEEWRKQDATRIEMEHKLWASERSWIEARDSALMEAFHKMSEIRSTSQNPTGKKWEMVNNHVVKCNNKKRNIDESSICNQGGSSGGDYSTTIMRLNDHNGNSSEQCLDDQSIRLNSDHQENSSRRHHHHHHHHGNVISEGCFRYFMGDPYGRFF